MEMLISSGRSGRPKQPLEKREVLSDHPHHNRKGEPDLPMGETLALDAIPSKPPVKLTKYEKECWDNIVGTQVDLGKSAWIFRSDCAYLLGACVLYGQMMDVRNEVNADRRKKCPVLDMETGKADARIALLGNLTSKYLSALSALGIAPTRRQIVGGSDDSKMTEAEKLFTQ